MPFRPRPSCSDRPAFPRRAPRGARPVATLAVALTLVHAVGGCGAAQDPLRGPDHDATARNPAHGGEATVVAYVEGQPIRWADLTPAVAEAMGGTLLADAVLDRVLARRLAQRGIELTQEDLQRERERLLATLDPNDADAAERLLRELRQRRGLGRNRFDRLLRRNAMLRALTAGGVTVGGDAMQRAYALRYGPRFQGRLILAETLADAAAARADLVAGRDFAEAAMEHSVDLSRAQGGLLSPISPADPTYPESLRRTLADLEPGEVSEPFSLPPGFAVVKLERRIEGDPPPLADVEDELRRWVRLRLEREAMTRLARSILRGADVVVLAPAMQQAWAEQQRQLEAAAGTP